jgi:phage terminase large subunit-like protein
VVSLYEQSKIFHLKTLPLLEEQMCSYVPFKSNFSPDRMDALVWALTELTSTPRPRLRKVWSVG